MEILGMSKPDVMTSRVIINFRAARIAQLWCCTKGMGPAGLGAEPGPVASIRPHLEAAAHGEWEQGRPPPCAGLWGHAVVPGVLFWAGGII